MIRLAAMGLVLTALTAFGGGAFSRVTCSYENVPEKSRFVGRVLAERIAELTPASDAAKALAVTFRIDPSLTGECARVTAKAGRVEIAGARTRSLYYGVGRLLGRIAYGETAFGLADGTFEIRPAKPLRIAYWARHFHNWYQEASSAELKRSAEDMMLMGCNGFHFLYAFPTMNRPGAGAAEVEAYLRKSRDVYDHVKAMDAFFSEEGGGNQLPADSPRWLLSNGAVGDIIEQFNGCPSVPGAVDYMLDYRRKCLGELKGVRPDWFRAWPYDEGGCKCEKCAPWGGNGYLRLAKRQAEVNRAHAPEGRTMVSTWLFDDREYEALWAYLAKPESAWIDALLIDAHGDFPNYPLTHKLPRDIPVVTFPEISMWGRNPWGGYGAIAMPERFERLFRQVEHLASGFEFYSEGIFEDLNKFVVAGLYVDPSRHARELVCDYARRHFPGGDPERFADFVKILESTQEMPGTAWKYDPMAQPEAVLQAFARKTADAAALARELDPTLLPTARRSWRWRLFAIRASADEILFRTRDWFTPELAPLYDELRRIYKSSKPVSALSNDTGHHAVSPMDPDVRLKGRPGDVLTFRGSFRNVRDTPVAVKAAFAGNAGIVFRRGGFVERDGSVAWGGERTLAPGEEVTLAGEIAVAKDAEPGRLYRCRMSRLWLGLQVESPRRGPAEVNAEKAAADAAPAIPKFGEKAKKGQWDAWSSTKSSERPCANWKTLNGLDLGLKELGRLRTRRSKDIRWNDFSVDCGTLDRDMADFESYRPVMGELGVKRARFCSGWAKTEQEKGKYDFAWLDAILDGTIAEGIEPWVVLQYGNPVYGSDYRLGMKVRQLTGNPEAFAAWMKYVEATVARYRDRVRLWEIWNEPYGQGEDYATLAIETARVVKRVQPDAELMLTAMDPPDHDVCLRRFAEAGVLKLFKWWSFHPYWGYPEGTWEWQAPDLRKKVVKANPDFRIFQGEAGCPCQMEFGHALRGFNWSEFSQAKWVSRRLMCDYGEGVPSSIFSMIDNQYTYMLQSFGMIRSDLLKEFIYRRPSFYTMSHFTALFDDRSKTLGWTKSVPFAISRAGDQTPPRDPYLEPKRLSVARFTFRDGKPGFAAWYGSRFPGDSLGFDRISFSVPDVRLADPVLVEMITGRVFELGTSRIRVENGGQRLFDVPMWDGVLLFAERTDLDFDAEMQKKGKR